MALTLKYTHVLMRNIDTSQQAEAHTQCYAIYMLTDGMERWPCIDENTLMMQCEIGNAYDIWNIISTADRQTDVQRNLNELTSIILRFMGGRQRSSMHKSEYSQE